MVYPNNGLTSATTYCYRLRAKNGSGFSAYSNEACGTTAAASGAPAAPSNVSLANITSSGMNVFFTDNATNETGIDIERKTGVGGTYGVITTTSALSGASAGWYYPNSGLTSATTYCYRLRAKNGSGFSAYSNEACGTTQ